jgi:hypothetical protein
MADPLRSPSGDADFRKDVEDVEGSPIDGAAPAAAAQDYDVDTVERVYKKIDLRIIPRE